MAASSWPITAPISRARAALPHVPETLKRLADTGATLGVCTNKPQDLTDLLLAQLDLARHFGAVYGGGRASHNKPDPHHVLELVDALKGTPGRAVMVGDSTVDVAAARAAQIPVIVMSYGYSRSPPANSAAALGRRTCALPELISA